MIPLAPYKRYTRVRELAGLGHRTDVPLHGLRHIAATPASSTEAGVPVWLVTELLGYESAAITAGICQHVPDRLLHEASQQIADTWSAEEPDQE